VFGNEQCGPDLPLCSARVKPDLAVTSKLTGKAGPGEISRKLHKLLPDNSFHHMIYRMQ
jgi:hypothetical protein